MKLPAYKKLLNLGKDGDNIPQEQVIQMYEICLIHSNYLAIKISIL